jgi:hypothetical protein
MGAYRRRIRLERVGDAVEGGLEDDFHHFRVTVSVEDGSVVAVEGEAVRYPWSSCASATGPIEELAHGAADPKQNCTHLFDLAQLAIAHAASGRDSRQYDVLVPDRDEAMRTEPVLRRDGEVVLRWQVESRHIGGPDPFTGVSLRGGFADWAATTLDADTAEAAIVLRRACMISMGRLMDLDVHDRADELGEIMLGTCHTFQPGVIETSVRMKGSTRDYSLARDAENLLRRL